jgi:DDE superfamily endonuclease
MIWCVDIAHGDLTRRAQISWRGNQKFVKSAVSAMYSMHHDEDANFRQLAQTLLVLVIDGSGTSCQKPVHPNEAQLTFCYWKKEYQVRWYVVTDLAGRIVFVAGPYSGKYDDTKVLKDSGFYRSVALSRIV